MEDPKKEKQSQELKEELTDDELKGQTSRELTDDELKGLSGGGQVNNVMGGRPVA